MRVLHQFRRCSDQQVPFLLRKAQRLREYLTQYDETKAVWSDPVRRSFEQDFWAPLERQTPTMQRDLERLAQVIAQAQRQAE